MKKFTIKDDKLNISIGGPDFYQTLEFIKTIPGRKYDPVTKLWSVPCCDENKELLISKGFNDNKKWTEDDEPVDESYREMDIELPSFLRKYQRDALKYIRFHDNFAYLGAPMGSGKTIMSLAHIELNGFKKNLIVCPAGVKLNFRNDYKKFFKKNLYILSGMDSVDHYENEGTYVINYELLSRSMETTTIEYKKRGGGVGTRKITKPSDGMLKLVSSNFDCVVSDESHRLKNEDSQAFKAFKLLAQEAGSVLLMSGTPILSRPAEIFGPFSQIKPKLFNSQNKYSFLNRYCAPKTLHIRGRGTIMTYTGATNTKELHVLLRKNGLLVIPQEELNYELPTVISRVSVIELDADYQAYKEKLYDEVAENPGMALASIEKLKQFSVQHKLENCIDYINNVLEIEEKVVVFASHKSVVDFLHKKYKHSVPYNGDVSPAQKEKNKNAFINDPKVRMIIGNTESMGVGVDGLQHSGSSSMIFIEFPWNPAMVEQAIARLVRSGYKGDAHVNVHFLAGEGTIEEEIMELLDTKKGVFESVVNGADVQEDDLLTYMKEKFLEEARAYSRRRKNGNKDDKGAS